MNKFENQNYAGRYFANYNGTDEYSKCYKQFTVKVEELAKQLRLWNWTLGDNLVVDLGAADGSILRDLHAALGGEEEKYVGCELTEHFVGNTVWDGTVTADVLDYLESLETGSVGLAICNVLMYIQDAGTITRILENIARVLSHNGVAVIVTMNNWYFGSLVNEDEEWKDLISTGKIIKGKFKHNDSNDVTFAAPVGWWVTAMKSSKLGPNLVNKENDIFICRAGNSNQYKNWVMDVYPMVGNISTTGTYAFGVLVGTQHEPETYILTFTVNSDENDSDGIWTADKSIPINSIAAISVAMMNGYFGPVRNFRFKPLEKVKANAVYHPFVLGAKYFPEEGIFVRDVEL